MSSLKTELQNLKACLDAVDWVGRKSLKTAWAKCERGDWMLWYAHRAGVDRKLLVLAACDCASTALQYVPDGELRPALAIQAARDWCAGTGTARAAAGAAARAAAEAARAAAWATARAAAWAAAWAAARAAARAAEATGGAEAAGAAAWAARAAAEAAAHKQCADLVRARIPYSLLEEPE